MGRMCSKHEEWCPEDVCRWCDEKKSAPIDSKRLAIQTQLNTEAAAESGAIPWAENKHLISAMVEAWRQAGARRAEIKKDKMPDKTRRAALSQAWDAAPELKEIDQAIIEAVRGE